MIGAYKDDCGNILSKSDAFWIMNGYNNCTGFTSGSSFGGWNIGGAYYEPGNYYYNSETNQIRYLDQSGTSNGAWL